MGDVAIESFGNDVGCFTTAVRVFRTGKSVKGERGEQHIDVIDADLLQNSVDFILTVFHTSISRLAKSYIGAANEHSIHIFHSRKDNSSFTILSPFSFRSRIRLG